MRRERFLRSLFLLILLVAIGNAAAENTTAENLSVINESDPVAWFNRGEALLNLSKYNESIEAFDKAIQLNQSYAAAWSFKGEVFRELGKFNESLDAYNKAVELDPQYAAAWNGKGNVLKDLGKYDQAIEAYDQAIRIDPNYTEALVGKGAVLTLEGRYDQAIQAYDEAIRIDPNHAEAWILKGGSLHSQGKYDEAVKAYDEALRLEPNLSETWYNKGHALGEQGNYEEAVKAFNEAIRIDPSLATAWILKGGALHSQGKYDDAIKAYDEAIRLYPNQSLIWVLKGSAIFSKGEYDEAVKAYDEAIRIEPHLAMAWYNKGRALDAQGKYDEAIKNYDEAIRLDPNYLDAWGDKGNALEALGKHDEAVKVYDEIIRLNPNLAVAWYNKGIALKALGKNDEAIQAYDEAIRIDPNYGNAWNNKGNALLDLGKYDEAIQAYDKAIELDPKYKWAWNNKGLVLYDQGRYAEATQAYDKAIEIDPKWATPWNNKGDAFKRLGNYNESIDAYNKAIELDPEWETPEENSRNFLKKLGKNAEVKAAFAKEGYELAIQSVDIDGNKVYLELIKDGQVVDSRVIIPANEVDDTYVYSKPDTPQAIKVHFKNAFRGVDQNLATIDNVSQTAESDPSRVLINSTNEYTIASGTPLKLEEGYELAIQSVDIDGNKVYLELIKNGQVVDSRVIIPANEVDDTYVYSRTDTPQGIRVHFKNAFRGADQDLATIDIISQTSEGDPSRILINDSYLTTITSGTLLMLEEGYELAIQSVDIDGNKVYLELIKDGQVVDSRVIIPANEVDDTYVYSKPDTPQGIRVHFKNAFRGADQNLATIDIISQTSESDPSRMLINDTNEYTIASGTPLKLEEGYELAIKSIDIDGNKAYLELFKDGQILDSKVIIESNEVDDTFAYSKPGTSQAIKVHFKNAFRGANQNLVTIDIISQTSESDLYRMLINSTNEYTIASRTPLKLEEGYELAIKSIDIDGNKVYLELIKDGQVVDSKVIIASNEVDDTYVYSKPGTSQAIKVHFKNAFRGRDQTLTTIDSVSQTLESDPSRVLVNNTNELVIASRTALKLEEGYELAIKSIDIDGNKVYLELFKDGQILDSKVIIASNEVDDTYVYSKPDTQQAIKVHFKNAFRGADQSLVTIDNTLQTFGNL